MPVAPWWRFKMVTDWLATSTLLSVIPMEDDYTWSAADQFLDDVIADTIGDSVPLPNPQVSLVAGTSVWLSIDDDPPVELTGIPAEADVAGLWVYDATGDPETSRLLAFLTQLADSTPLAFRANGGVYQLTFPAGWVARL